MNDWNKTHIQSGLRTPLAVYVMVNDRINASGLFRQRLRDEARKTDGISVDELSTHLREKYGTDVKASDIADDYGGLAELKRELENHEHAEQTQ